MSMKPKTYPILIQAVENGVAYGFHRAYKHNDKPSDDEITDAITNAVITELFEWFDIDSQDFKCYDE